jgi:hypothetical protein
MTVVFVTIMHPGGGFTGAEVATRAFVDALRAGGRRVVVVAYRRTGQELEPGPDDVIVADRHIETSAAGVRALGWMASSLVRREPYTLTKFRSRAMRDGLADVLARERPSLVVLDHTRVTWNLPPGGFGCPVAFVAHNVEHAMYAKNAAGRRAPLSWVHAREARALRRLEADVVRRADGIWTLTSSDADALAALGARVKPRSFGLPPSASLLAGLGSNGVTLGHDVGLLGSWTWGPNAAGLSWFCSDVAPELPSSVGVAIGGAGAEAIAAGFDYRGRVPDASEFLHASRVIAVPSTTGGGVQLKTLDAIATGRPVVATSIAMRGLEDPPATVRVADDPREFAAALVDSLQMPVDGAAARAWVAARRDRFQADIDAAVAEVAG